MNSTYKCVLLSAAAIVVTIVFFYLSATKINEGFTSFARCRAQGYSKEFCVQTPVSVWGPAGCQCPDGSRGIIHPGLRGECLCSRFY